MSERKCIKFTGYIYIPNEDSNHDELRSYSAKTMGRIEVFDEYNRKTGKRMEAFDNLGDMLSVIMRQYKKRVLRRVPTKRKKR